MRMTPARVPVLSSLPCTQSATSWNCPQLATSNTQAAGHRPASFLIRFNQTKNKPTSHRQRRQEGRTHARMVNHPIFFRGQRHVGKARMSDEQPKRSAGRPRIHPPKIKSKEWKIDDSVRLTIIISQAEKTRLEALAKAAGLTTGELIRRILAGHTGETKS